MKLSSAIQNPAHYDELLEIETRVEEMPLTKVHINHTLRSKERNAVIAEGYVELVFIKKETKKLTRAPEFFINAMKNHFDEV